MPINRATGRALIRTAIRVQVLVRYVANTEVTQSTSTQFACLEASGITLLGSTARTVRGHRVDCYIDSSSCLSFFHRALGSAIPSYARRLPSNLAYSLFTLSAVCSVRFFDFSANDETCVLGTSFEPRIHTLKS